jgi:isopenicillin N synthase-like dioxygenase
MPDIPFIDIAPFRLGTHDDRRRTAQAFGAAFEDVGFAIVAGHGVPEALGARAHAAAVEFFALPTADKMAAAIPERIKVRGYMPFGIESVARTHEGETPPDLCEALVFSAMHLDPESALPGGVSAATGNIVPARPADLFGAYRAYFLAMRELSGLLFRLAALSLDLPEGHFGPYVDRRRGKLRTVHYPEQAVAPLPGQLRYGAHTDFGSLTILRQDDAPGGLQAQFKTGEWADVKPIPGTFVVNAGDLMARWTNDRWRSGVHRVVNPPRDARGSTRRVSLVFFSEVNEDAIIECLPTCRGVANPAKYLPISAEAHRLRKIDISMPPEMAVPS